MFMGIHPPTGMQPSASPPLFSCPLPFSPLASRPPLRGDDDDEIAYFTVR